MKHLNMYVLLLSIPSFMCAMDTMHERSPIFNPNTITSGAILPDRYEENEVVTWREKRYTVTLDNGFTLQTSPQTIDCEGQRLSLVLGKARSITLRSQPSCLKTPAQVVLWVDQEPSYVLKQPIYTKIECAQDTPARYKGCVVLSLGAAIISLPLVATWLMLMTNLND